MTYYYFQIVRSVEIDGKIYNHSYNIGKRSRKMPYNFINKRYCYKNYNSALNYYDNLCNVLEYHKDINNYQLVFLKPYIDSEVI